MEQDDIVMNRINVCLHRHGPTSRALPELLLLWPEDFSYGAFTCNENNKNLRRSKRAYAGFYFERLSLKTY